MTGTLKFRLNNWFVSCSNKAGNLPIKQRMIPVYPKDINNELVPDSTVKFELIDEFTHPELYTDIAFMDGVVYAKL
ncbi:hypothetical protein UFOVP1307_106 [uncultured Caudovirales phage]|uniref:Uncharacterized protein n=1 Tax=uncultured Caudovirales phage TaxID=2100421 RepID=A0A6J5PMZ1_9CAUD|nr:hypothetical protein UFOVP651_17 [uncultured Caudovirales phage]CAB4170731.1 hypothetical protein UFOVP902_96 [uncultured Caudovirales phage]CAB4198472.1 hypothetical protein UFOVP1307_106 [uncultured Caudovirales phage]